MDLHNGAGNQSLSQEEKGTSNPSISPQSVSPPPVQTSDLADPNDTDLTTRVFQFLSTATPANLGAIAAGLAAITYFILGQIGLLIIGAFGGIVLFVQWEARNPDVSRAVKGERGIDAIARVLALTKDNKNFEDKDRDLDEEERSLARGFDDFRPETRDALNGLVDAIIRDYVKWWYSPILPTDRSFPLSSQKVLTSFLLSVSNHLSRKRPADAFLDFLTNSSSIIIVFFAELSAVFAEIPPESKISTPDAVHGYLAANPDSSLANLLSQKQQAGKFRMVAEDLLEFLDRPTLDCDPARVFLREILAGVVLEKTLQTCSNPEWINSWIVYLLEAGEPDFNQAIDVGMQTRSDAVTSPTNGESNVEQTNNSKSNRNSFDAEKSRRKEQLGHRKQLSKADEEMEEAMEEIKRLNQMIADDEARRVKHENGSVEAKGTEEAEERLAGAMQRNADELDIQASTRENVVDAPIASPGLSDRVSPKGSSSSDDLSTNRDSLQTPITPRSSTAESTSQNVSPTRNGGASFTNFDQIVPPARDVEEDAPKPKLPPLTLHNCTITIHDEPIADKGRIKNKPTWDFLIQIEPATSAYPGWMIVRKYSDFEKLHEVLRRIAAISGATAFTEQHANLPSWKVHTRSSLRGELERYVRVACWYQPLAESEGMKRFLEKSLGHAPTPSKSGFQAFENMGKNMLDVLANAPKGVAEGGKVLGAGVTGVLGNMGLTQRRSMPPAPPANSALQDVTSYTNRLSISTPPRMDSGLSVNTNSVRKPRDSLDSQRSSIVSTQPGKMPNMERRPSYNSQTDGDAEALQAGRPDRWDLASPSARNSQQNSRASSAAPLRSPSATSLSGIKLPPPPDQMPEDYGSPTRSSLRDSGVFATNGKDSFDSSRPLSMNGVASAPAPVKLSNTRTFSRLSEQETRVAVELVFAIINELYTLSSAWNIRRTLLAAAKSFLLRPGNPSLASIQSMIQTSVLDANTSDAGLAAHLRKLRENNLPTEEELAAWPPESSAEEKEKLRIKARKLLIKSGVPAALMGVMGANATTDALGRIFDCLQIEEVSRGLIFGVILQAIRVITH